MLIESLKLKRGWMVNGSHLNASALPIKRAQRTEEVHDKDESVLAVHMGHDSSIAVSRRGRVQCILELERLFQKRTSEMFSLYYVTNFLSLSPVFRIYEAAC